MTVEIHLRDLRERRNFSFSSHSRHARPYTASHRLPHVPLVVKRADRCDKNIKLVRDIRRDHTESYVYRPGPIGRKDGIPRCACNAFTCSKAETADMGSSGLKQTRYSSLKIRKQCLHPLRSKQYLNLATKTRQIIPTQSQKRRCTGCQSSTRLYGTL